MEAAQNGFRHSARLIRPFVGALRRLDGVPGAKLEALEALDADSWVTYAESARFCEWAVTATRDANLGLHAAQVIEPGEFDVVEYAARSSGTIGGALQVVNRYIGLLREGADFHLETDADICRWNLDMAMPTPRCINDWTVAVYVVLARRLTDSDWCPLAVHVTHQEPVNTDEYQRLLGAPVTFGARRNAILFHRDWLQTPVREADSHLHALMLRCAGERLDSKASTDTFVHRVRAAVAESLHAGQPCAAELARRFYMGERTIRRRLREAGTSYKELFDDVRFELACGYLEQRRELGMAEIAFMLGFSHTPAFSRAFRRWSGMTPLEYRVARRAHLQAAS